MKSSEWQLTQTSLITQDEWVTVERKDFMVPGRTEPQSFITIRRSDFVVIVATDDRGHLALVRQFRPGTEQWYWALPAGYIGVGETAEAAATRELAEETGYLAGQSELVCKLHPLPGYIKSAASVVFCSRLKPTAIGIDGEIDAFEWVSQQVAIDRVVSGDIVEMQAVAALFIVREKMSRRE